MYRLTEKIVSKLDSDLDLGYLTNPEHISIFMQMAIASDYYAPPFRYPNEYVSNYGRLETIYPIYQRMAEKDLTGAKTIYNSNVVGCRKGVGGECRYHPIVRKVLEELLQIS